MKNIIFFPFEKNDSTVDYFENTYTTLRNLNNLSNNVNSSTLSIRYFSWMDFLNYNLLDIQQSLFEINLIFCERLMQLTEYTNFFKDNSTKQFIIVTESFIPNDSNINTFKFNNIKIFNSLIELHMWGQHLYDPTTQLFWKNIIEEKYSNRYDFFCLLGRKDKIRSHFVNQIQNTLDISNSIFKYDTQNLGNTDAEQLDYITKKFPNNGLLTPIFNSPPFLNISTFMLHDFYLNSRFEIQIETSPWNITEYHITEKTLKPLVYGYPCIMLGAHNYNKWLQEFNIDLGMGLFDTSFDSIKDDFERIEAFINEIKKHISTTPIAYDVRKKYHNNNINGLYKLSNMLRTNEYDLYKHISHIH